MRRGRCALHEVQVPQRRRRAMTNVPTRRTAPARGPAAEFRERFWYHFAPFCGAKCPVRTMRSHYCGLVDERLTGEEVTVAGWVHRRRDHGGVIFVDLRDREGLLQIVFDPDAREVFAEAERLRNEYVVRVRGLVR